MLDPRQFKTVPKSEYEIQARKFLEDNEIRIEKQPFKWEKSESLKGKYHQVYFVSITRDYKDNAKNLDPYLTKNGFSFEFANSINDSEKMIFLGNYPILACLTKYDPISHENFCAEHGYDLDSIKGLETFNAVKKEWENVSKFFTTEELELLREIN
jgi:hypothetical protein